MRNTLTRAQPFVLYSIGFFMLMFAATAAGARDAETVYVEGFPERRSGSGVLDDLFFGDRVRSGESVITGRGDRAELELDDGSSIVVRADTVFTVREVDEDGRSRSAFSSSRGSVTYSLDGIRGRSSRIQSANATVGVRGTTFTVYAADDGGSLFLVDSGRIAVEAQGEEVELGENEAVEVDAGATPGEPFEVLRGEIDFSGWNNGRVNAVLENPVAAAEGAYRRLEEIVSELERAIAEYEPVREELRAEREAAEEVREEAGEDEFEAYYRDRVRPLESIAPRRYLNVRYWALSALNMRRYVFGRMYTILRSHNIMNPDARDVVAYREVHDRALQLLSDHVHDYLILEDI
ncbi:MAG: FecR domain-containing protein [Spirochaetales bacterium]